MLSFNSIMDYFLLVITGAFLLIGFYRIYKEFDQLFFVIWIKKNLLKEECKTHDWTEELTEGGSKKTFCKKCKIVPETEVNNTET